MQERIVVGLLGCIRMVSSDTCSRAFKSRGNHCCDIENARNCQLCIPDIDVYENNLLKNRRFYSISLLKQSCILSTFVIYL